MPTPPSPLPSDVRRWIDGQDADERDALARTWDLAALAAEPQPVATDEAWARLDALLDDGPAQDAPAQPADRPTAEASQAGLRAWQNRGRPDPFAVPTSLLARPAVWGSAVAAALVGVVAVGLWLQPVTQAAGGSVLAVALPDGSAVSLAPGAELAYARGLRGDARRVELSGQGYFDVTQDGRPFVVETFNAGVEVLGTEFDVQARPGVETVVALVEGSVRLRSAAGAVVLRPGETSRVAGGAPTAPESVAPGLLVAWRDGGFSVDDVPLGDVARAIGARFGRPVRLAPGLDADRRLTLFLPSADSADVVLRDLAAYLDLRVQVSANRYELLPR